jgi:hypothetical protein
VHVTDAGGAYFTEWQQHPIKFGEGILKFEEPIRFGRQDFGTLSLYVNLQDPLRSIRTHVLASQRREALSLLALALLIVAMASYAALQPFREMGDRAAGLLSQRGALKAAESGDETQRLRAALDLLQKMLEKK